MSLYDRVSELPIEVATAELSGRSAETSYGFTRPTTVVCLRGPDGAAGVGEDVTTDKDDHERFQREGVPDLAGSYTLTTFSDRVGDLPAVRASEHGKEATAGERDAENDDSDATSGVGVGWNEPGRARRWALESAALDLGLRQAGETLGTRLDRSYDPVRFVASLRLSDPPRLTSLEKWQRIDPDLEFKLDVPPDWDAAFVQAVADTARTDTRVLDFKAAYRDGDDQVANDPGLVERVTTAFPDTVLEDPHLSGPCWDAVADELNRLSFDAPITNVEAVETLPLAPQWLNIKPARFGSVRSLFDTLEYALDRDLTLYGGGMFELDRGRSHLHALASLFYPGGPNDVAPPGYNEPHPHGDVPSSPLEPPTNTAGLGF